VNPEFAVVGHPNKGKSSIVATLAHDDSVAISAQSGTTKVTERFTVNVGKGQYTLIDTPGFQRPARVLDWLQKQAAGADQRQAAVQRFIENSQCRRDFPDEVQLLTPILRGAAILYVVDGSRPYGADYEAEMEILRWTGQPSMALINPIENEDHVGAWQQALSQYFKVVKVFNAMQADFDKQLSILETFALLRDDWRSAIGILIAEYRGLRQRQREQSVEILVELLSFLCSYQVSQVVASREQARQLQPVLEQQYLHAMKEREARSHDALKAIYQYRNLSSRAEALSFEANLFDTEKWIIWGLNRRQLVAAAAMAGAAAGAAVDVSLAGHSLLLGAVGGGLLAAGSAWLGADRLAEFKVLGLPVGGYEARQGPIRNPNFPYVVISRFLFLEQALRQRTHARRDVLVIEAGDLAARIETLSPTEKKNLHNALDRLRRQKPVDDLPAALQPLIEQQGGH
jgi:hypothetical protein